jgi:hypothetical protein
MRAALIRNSRDYKLSVDHGVDPFFHPTRSGHQRQDARSRWLALSRAQSLVLCIADLLYLFGGS